MEEETNILYVDLYDNVLTEKKGDYMGKVAITGSLRNADIARRIVEKRTEYRPETIQNILDLADEEKIIALTEGKSCVDGVGQLLLRVSGSFDGEQAPFDPEKHSLDVSFTRGKTLRERLAKVTVATRAASGSMVVNSVFDPMSGETNGRITPASNLIISGVNIKIEGDDPACGVLLTPAEGEPVKPRLVTHNNPSELTILLPDMAEGEYTLSVTTQYGRGTALKQPRTYVFPVMLVVAGDTESGTDSPGNI